MTRLARPNAGSGVTLRSLLCVVFGHRRPYLLKVKGRFMEQYCIRCGRPVG